MTGPGSQEVTMDTSRAGLRGVLAGLVAAVVLVPSAALAGPGGPRFTPGDDGVGDDYFPYAGNGGYDVDHYHLYLTFQPSPMTDMPTPTSYLRVMIYGGVTSELLFSKIHDTLRLV